MKWIDDEPEEYEIYSDMFHTLVFCAAAILMLAAVAAAVLYGIAAIH